LRFKKIYIEITNSCNFDCSFCFKTKRANKFMSPDEFSLVIQKIRPFTDYIYLHVLGEPLLHLQLDEILTIAETAGLYINITTNGGLLERKKEILSKHNIRQMNISLHDAEENIEPDKWENYLQTVLNFAIETAGKTYISLRLWNTSNEASADFNWLCTNQIAAKFNKQMEVLNQNTNGKSLKLAEHIFLQRGPRFEWPEENKKSLQTQKTCYALRDHIAILVDGQVVPCCLDGDAALKLGDIFKEELSGILNSERAQKIHKGFLNSKITEDICKTCGFII